MALIFMFPGQSSRYAGMLPKVAALHPACAAVLDEASARLGRDLRAHYAAGNDAAYATNGDVQVGVFVTNHMFLALLRAEGIEAELSLGLSLGEWNHLVHIGALPFGAALDAVVARGAAYDAGPRGMMASVFPISAEDLEEVLERARGAGVVEVTNLNSPRQQVISGEAAAVEAALKLIEEDTFAQATIIERQVPMHASIFRPVGDAFRPTLERLPFAPPARPYLPNRLGRFLPDVTRERFVDLLATHVHMPVLWRQSIDAALERHPGATLLEVGPRRVLYNLLDRRWHRGVRKLHLDSAEETPTHVAEVLGRLRGDGEEARA